MAFMMPVVKNEWDIYKTNRNRRSSECSNPQACRSRKVSLSSSERDPTTPSRVPSSSRLLLPATSSSTIVGQLRSKTRFVSSVPPVTSTTSYGRRGSVGRRSYYYYIR